MDTTTTPTTQPPALKLKNGTYTVASPTGGHVTIKLHTAQQGKLAGRRIFSLLVGSNNETDYQGVAFWDDAAGRANVWQRFRGPHPKPEFPIDGYHWQRTAGWGSIEKKLAVLLDVALRGERGYWGGRGYTLHLEGRCVRCNRKLTTVQSIASGMGAKCAGKK